MPLLIDWNQLLGVAGLHQEAEDVAFVHAATVESMSAWPESTMRTVSGAISFTLARGKRAPFMSGMRMSETTTAKGPFDSIIVQTGGGAVRRLDFDTIAQLAADAIQHLRLVIDKQDSVAHECFPVQPWRTASRHSFQRSMRPWASR